MKIYHVETQQAYDELMIELEEKGCEWLSGHKPTSFNYWEQNKESSYIKISGKEIVYRDVEFCKNEYPNIPIIEYKAKGENMAEETEAYLQEAKSAAKKIIEKIDKYLKSVNPKFKKGDIVASKIFTDDSLSFIQLNQDLNNWCNSVDGFWYIKRDCKVYDRSLEVFKEDTRHATPTEIAEYESALQFHKHGRKPFEVKGGDILRDNEVDVLSVSFSRDWKKEDFTSGRYTFLKTAEECNELLENK